MNRLWFFAIVLFCGCLAPDAKVIKCPTCKQNADYKGDYITNCPQFICNKGHRTVLHPDGTVYFTDSIRSMTSESVVK